MAFGNSGGSCGVVDDLKLGIEAEVRICNITNKCMDKLYTSQT